MSSAYGNTRKCPSKRYLRSVVHGDGLLTPSGSCSAVPQHTLQLPRKDNRGRGYFLSNFLKNSSADNALIVFSEMRLRDRISSLRRLSSFSSLLLIRDINSDEHQTCSDLFLPCLVDTPGNEPLRAGFRCKRSFKCHGEAGAGLPANRRSSSR